MLVVLVGRRERDLGLAHADEAAAGSFFFSELVAPLERGEVSRAGAGGRGVGVDVVEAVVEVSGPVS